MTELGEGLAPPGHQAAPSWQDAADTPLSHAAFADLMARLGPWAVDRRVGVAVSGGADSLCLALLAAAWGKPLAFIVDHGLRPESASEARLTAARLARLGIENRILTLTGLGKSAAAARAARYAALTEAAGEAQLLDMLLGHHALDQAETVLMRGRAASGKAGQAGMARVVHGAALRFVRPLLDTAPGRLRATLRQAGVGWVEDPSNRDPRYLRSRLRVELSQGGEAARWHQHSMQAAAVRRGAEEAGAGLLARRVQIYPEGFAWLSPGPLTVAALGALIRCIGGADFAPATRALARVARDPAPCVLGGVRLLPAGKFGPGLLLVREAAAMHPPVPANPGTVWDGRYLLYAEDTAMRDGGSGGTGTVPPALSFGALGPDSRKVRHLSPLPAAILQTLPALRQNGMLAAVPHIGYRADGALDGLVASFIPAHPLAGAAFDASDDR